MEIADAGNMPFSLAPRITPAQDAEPSPGGLSEAEIRELPTYWNLFNNDGESIFTVNGTPYQADVIHDALDDEGVKKAWELTITNIRTGYGTQENKFGITGTVGTSGARQFLREAEKRALAVAKSMPQMGALDVLISRSKDTTRSRLYQRIFSKMRSIFPGTYATLEKNGEQAFVFVKPKTWEDRTAILQTLQKQGFKLDSTNPESSRAEGGSFSLAPRSLPEVAAQTEVMDVWGKSLPIQGKSFTIVPWDQVPESKYKTFLQKQGLPVIKGVGGLSAFEEAGEYLFGARIPGDALSNQRTGMVVGWRDISELALADQKVVEKDIRDQRDFYKRTSIYQTRWDQGKSGVQQGKVLANKAKGFIPARWADDGDLMVYDGNLYRGEQSPPKVVKTVWLKDSEFPNEGIGRSGHSASGISGSFYPRIAFELSNGAVVSERIRISDHPQVSMNAPRPYAIDLRANGADLKRKAFRKIVEANEQAVWSGINSLVVSDWNAQKRQPSSLTGQDVNSFSLAPRSLPEVADTVLSARMRVDSFREPMLKVMFRKLADLRADGEWRVDKRGIASKRIGFDSRMAGIRSPENIEAERKFRLRSRQRELIDAGMLALPPATLAAYDQGVASLEDVPIVKDMLGKVGKIMSKSTAQRLGKLKTDGVGSAGDYDGAPRLPPSWYSSGKVFKSVIVTRADGSSEAYNVGKVPADVQAEIDAGKATAKTKETRSPAMGGQMPYEIADQLSDLGHLKDGYADTLWDALRSAIYSTRTANEGFQKARDAVRKVETDALAQARKESDQWAKDETAKIPTEKDRQMMALRTLDAILSAFSPDIRAAVGGFVKLASLGSDKSREAEIIRRLDKLDEVVERAAKKHYGEIIEKLFRKAAPKRDSGKKPTGKLGAETQALVDLAETFSEMTEAKVAGERTTISERMAAIAEEMIKAKGAKLAALESELIDLIEREQILDLFGAVYERTSAEMESAAEWLAETYTKGRNVWRAVIDARAADAKARQKEAKADIGKEGLDSEQQAAIEAAKTISGGAKSMTLNWLSFEQVIQAALGRKSTLGRDTVRAARAATSGKTDALRAKRDNFRAAMASIFGTTKVQQWQSKLFELSQIGDKSAVKVTKMEGAGTDTKTIPAEIVDRIINGKADAKAYGLDSATLNQLADAWADNEALPANRRKDNLTYEVVIGGKATPTTVSQLQAVHITMLARQASYTANMAGHGWTEDVLKDIESQLTPEAKGIRDFLAEEYRTGYDSLNAVYSRMYGLNLPRLTNYAPGTFEARDMMGAEIDPYGQGLLSEGGFKAGMLKTRAKHSARPRLEDALSVYWGHVNATEHFKSFGEFARDIRATLNNADVRASITAKGGKSLLETAQQWMTAFERNGLEVRESSSKWAAFIRKRQSVMAYIALAYNAGTLMKQSSAAFGSLMSMGPGAAMKQLAKLFTGQLELGESYRSAVIQRRLDAGYSPEVRQAMAGMMAEKPTWGSPFVMKGMELIGMVDAIFTTASHAMAYDHHYAEAKAAGLTDAQAKREAEREAEATVARTSQPAEMMDRSLGELSMGANARTFFMFATDARQKAALILEAYQPSSGLSKGERATRLITLHIVFPLMAQAVTSMMRDARDDDDDELFDEKNWQSGDFMKAMVLGPLMGIPIIGGALNAGLTPVFGGHYFANDPTQPLNRAAGAAVDFTEAIEEGDLEGGLKAAKAALGGAALIVGGDRAAAVAVGAGALYDAVRIAENTFGD
jgi:hypothetical protein